jgi:NitT/TauT family transport system permease protein
MKKSFGLRSPISRRKFIIIAVLSFVVLIGIWTLLTEAGLVNSLFLPSPVKVVQNLINGWKDGTLLQNSGISIYRVVMGFLLAVALGVPAGILVGSFKSAEALIRPLCEFVRYMPVPAFVPLVMVWTGIGEMAKITLVFLGTFFQLVLMIADDAASVPEDLLSASYTLGTKRWSTIIKVLIPAVAPRIMETLRMCIGWAWTYLVVAELVASSSGLGFSILKAQKFFQTEAIFSGILTIGIIGLITDRIFALAIRLMFPWQERGGT